MRIKNGEDLSKLKRSIMQRRDKNRMLITVCGGTGCRAYGCEDLIAALKNEVEKSGLKGKVEVKATGCPGFCERGNLVVIYPEGIFYQRVKTEDVPDIIKETIVGKKIVDRLLFVDQATGQKVTYEKDVPFYKKQTRLLLGNNAIVDPTDIEDYVVIGGYSALAKALSTMKPEKVIEEVKKAGLRGRGGAGFPTGLKWEITRKAKGTQKYVVCNADEGDPGAFMDRSLLEGNPHSILEGLTIGAYAIGASKGFVYVRNEYPLAVQNVTLAVEQARERGLLGERILGTEFSFDVEIVRGAGAFVCGEETALIASIEGARGVPKQRPPFPSDRGIWGKPTNINNVETWANVPIIIEKGADWYSKVGTKGSKGTKIFALVGKINNTGLVEVPMGTTISETVYGIGGGIPNGKQLKAIQIGGPSGGCIPKTFIDVPIDYDELKKLGGMMGSGGMVVMDEDTCMVDVAKYFLEFLLEESCGKCTTCRDGIERMLEIVTRITEGNGTMKDLDTLSELAEVVRDASMCGLGQTSPNPVLSTLRHFRDEYMAHIKDKKCPGRVCKALITYSIEKDKCTSCGACKKRCPQGAISGEKGKPYKIDPSKCIRCNVCYETCKFGAIKKE
ncbi:MAG: NADH-ubiquinone oxidoreductase-F iron-sulfur binding region domain-containing protein [Thermoplasmata archaeon]